MGRLDKEDNRRAGACHPGLGMLNRKTGFGLEDLYGGRTLITVVQVDS